MTSTSLDNQPRPTRNTHRKKLIRNALESAYGNRAVLLDELRWKVRQAESDQSNAGNTEMSRSWANSFARTIREQFPEYVIQKIPIDGNTPVGLVARTAIYRQKSLSQLRDFLESKEPCILCRYKTNMDVDEPRFTSRYVTPHYHVATFRFFTERPTLLSYEVIQRIPGALIPCTHKLSLIVPPGANAKPETIADVPWQLFRYEQLDDWYEVDPQIGLYAVKRNSR